MNLLDFEKQHKDILETIEEWNYLRIKVGFFLKNKDQNRKKIQRRNLFTIIRFSMKSLRYAFYKFSNWFGKYEYIFFSDSSERRLINHKYFDKLSDDIIYKLGKNTLLIENPTAGHYSNSYTENIVSLNILKAFIAILSIVNITVSNESIKRLQKILNKNNINIDPMKEIKKFKISYYVYKVLFKIYKPKVVFVNCAYCMQSMIKAANDLHINTIEIQHGVISNMHFGYVSCLKINNSYYAQQLLSFGEQEKKLANMIIPSITPIGNFYLEYISKNFVYNEQLRKYILPYRISIGVSMQDQEWERKLLFDFIRDYSEKYSDTLFILIPRKKKSFPPFPKNVMVFDQIDCYETIMHCDIHMTLYSSCALEAPSLGIPNILLNKKNMAQDYYEDLLDSYHTRFVNTIEESRKYIKELLILNKHNIVKKNNNVFYEEYSENILTFLQDIKNGY